jgi:hypothetical protein
MKRALFVIAVLATTTGIAEAYPQFQLSRDQTCTGCHIAPSGGGLLNENGLATAESTSQFGTAPEFFYGKVPSPDWLILGGDLRGAAGYLKYGGPEDSAVYAFPMQGDIYAHLKFGGGLSLHVTAGIRPAQEGHAEIDGAGVPVYPGARNSTRVWSREHYFMWRQNPDENYGLYVRAGRFMPVFGLRMAEHPIYTRRFGGTQLYSDTYGVAVEHVGPKFEFHVTGFIEDYAIDPVEHANGFALYGEYRLSETLAFGVEGMFKSFTNGKSLFSDELNTDVNQVHLGVTNKLYLEGPDLLFQTEIQFVNQIVDKVNRSDDSRVGGAPKGLVGNLTVSKMLADFLLLDVGIGHYDSNWRIANLDRDCVDLNLHWFTTSHLELILNTRYELIGFNKGGDPGAYALLQLHYRL